MARIASKGTFGPGWRGKDEGRGTLWLEVWETGWKLIKSVFCGHTLELRVQGDLKIFRITRRVNKTVPTLCYRDDPDPGPSLTEDTNILQD